MSVESLKSDLQENLATLKSLRPELASAADLVRHLNDTLWPFLESVVDEVADIDDCVADMLSGAEDILQPETAETFAAIIAGAVAVAAALRQRITRDADPELSKVVDELEQNCRAGEAILTEIVIDPGDDEPDAGDDDGDDDDDEPEGDD